MPDGTPTSISVVVNPGPKQITLDDSVVGLRIEDHDRLIDEARISLADGFQQAGAALERGTAVHVSIGFDDTLTKMFIGRIVSVGGEDATPGSTPTAGRTTLVLHDLSAVMHDANNGFSAKKGEKLSAFVTRIAAKHQTSFQVGKIHCDPDPTFEAANLPRQLRHSDFEFLQMLARTWGARCFVEVNDDKPKFYFMSIQQLWAAKSLGVLQMCRGYGSLLTFKYERIAARATRQLMSAALDPVSGETVVGDSGAVTPAPLPTGNLGPAVREAEPGLQASQAKLAAASATTTPKPDPPMHRRGAASDPARARTYVIVDPTQASGLRAEAGALGHTDLRAKGRVTLTGMAPWAEGDWWVKRVAHVVTPRRKPDGRWTGKATYECNLELTR